MSFEKVLKDDGVIIHPTDTVFGISALFTSKKGYKKIYSLKERSFSKPLGILISSYDQLPLFTNISLDEIKVFIPFLELGTTLIVSLKEGSPLHLKEQSEFIAFRKPCHSEILGLIDKVGPLVCTSANISGQSPIENSEEAKKVFPNVPVFPGSLPQHHVPSSILKFNGSKYTLIREGHISKEEFEEKLKVLFKGEIV